MIPVAHLAAGATLALAVWASPLSPVPRHPVVVEHTVRPARIQPGQEAVVSLVVEAPDGMRLSVRDAERWRMPLEQRGAWHVDRAVRDGGPVVWRFTVPFTVWEAGAHRTPGIVVARRAADGTTRDTVLEGSYVTAVSPLPENARTLRPAAAAGPLPPPSTRTTRWAAVPFVLTLLSGLTWWRSGRSGHEGADTAAAPEALRPGAWARQLRTALARAPEAPGRAAEEVARLARLHREAVASGVRPWHTTGEAVALVETATGGAGAEASASLSRALLLADAVKFGGARPAADDVVRAGEALLEAFGDA